MANKTVEEIVEKAKSGDKSAFDLLYREYSEKLLKYVVKLGVNSYDAEDIVSESFMEAIEHIGDLKSNAFFSTWLHTIAKNKVYTMKKKEQKHTRVDFSSDEGDEQNDALDIAVSEAAEYNGDTIMLPEDYAENEEIKQILADTINSLNPDQRDAVYLFYYKNNSIGEIAEQAGVSENTIKSRLSLARKYMERKLKKLQKNGVTLCAVPIPVILNIVVSESKLKAAAPVVTTAAGGATSGAAVSAVSGKIGALIAAGIMIGGGVGIYTTLSDRSGNIRKGDTRTADSSSVMISDASSIDSRNDWDPDLIKVVDTDTVESTIAVDDASSHTDNRPTNTNQGNIRTTQPNQQTQPTQQVITYYDDVGQVDGDNYDESTTQEEQWEDIEFGHYDDKVGYIGIKKYCYDPETGNITTINSIKREANTGTVVINYTTAKEDNRSFDLCALLIDYNIGIKHDGVYISPKDLVHDGNNHTATYQNDVLKDDSYSYVWVTQGGTDYDYVDEYGAYNKSTNDENYYTQNIILDNSGTAHISKDACEIYYQYDSYSTSYVWLEFLDRDTLTTDVVSYIKSMQDEIKRYNTGIEKSNYFLDDNISAVKNVVVENGSKYFEMIDGILYFKFNSYRWLLWTTEHSPNHLKFPDNVVIYNYNELEKIHMSDYNDVDFGNNTWLRNDTSFLNCLDITLPEEW